MTRTRSIPSAARRHPAVLAGDAARAMRDSVLVALLRAESAQGAELAPLCLPPAPVATAPLQLAAAQTTDDTTRCELVASYEHCLRSYRDIARSRAPDTTDDDLGAAVALFVAVNLRVLHGVDPHRSMMLSLKRQLCGVSRRVSNWEAISPEERQTFFERIAILAVLVLGSHAHAAAQGSSAQAKVRQASEKYLHDMFGIDPELLTLGTEGLVVRPVRNVPAAGSAGRAA